MEQKRNNILGKIDIDWRFENDKDILKKLKIMDYEFESLIWRKLKTL